MNNNECPETWRPIGFCDCKCCIEHRSIIARHRKDILDAKLLEIRERDAKAKANIEQAINYCKAYIMTCEITATAWEDHASKVSGDFIDSASFKAGEKHAIERISKLIAKLTMRIVLVVALGMVILAAIA
jgi:hypothetical protein